MTTITQRSSRGGRRRLIAAFASLAVLVTTLTSPITAAAAGPAAPAAVPGGPATVTTSVDYVSGADLSTPITELKASYGTTTPTHLFALSIGYTCTAASPCTDVSITIAPQQLDSIYGQYRFARYSSSTLPAGGSISGSDAAGYTVTLGDLAAGATGAFTVAYIWQDRGTSVAPQSFFLDGEQIVNTVTIDAANAGEPRSASDAITWHIDTMSPQVSFAAQGLARADENYNYVLRMGSDCMWYRTTANHGEPSKLCAAEYTNVFHLPPGAEYIGTSPDGVYDATARTVTWSASGASAATGWGSANGFSTARTVTVRFPASYLTESCTGSATASFETSVTYLDGQKKTADTAVTNEVTSCTPFALASRMEKWSSLSLNPNIVWDSGNAYSYSLRIGNRANVPGVAKITDDQLGADHIRAYSVVATGGTIAYVLDDGTTGTATGSYTAPAARRIVSVVVTSPEIAGPNKESTSTALVNYFTAVVRYTTVGTAPAEGWPLTNTASGVMTYPGTSLADYSAGSATTNLVITPRPANFNAVLGRTLTTPGNPVPGVPVDFSLHGVTSTMEPNATVEPQYVFVAPANWDIVAGSWSLATGAPAGAVFERKTVTIAGITRQALYVHWPAGTVWGVNSTWPALKVQATPSASAAPGTSSVATGYVGDASHSFPGYSSTWGGGNNDQKFTDAPDIDGDGVSTEAFAASNSPAITVGSAAALSTVKEICRVNPEAEDGCDWISDSTQAVPVSPVATDIRYRVTLRNNGTSALSNVVAYDVLPHVGDTGISSGSASTPRNSEFAESVGSVSAVSSKLTLRYSDSTNPCRTEVYAGGPVGCTDDWDTSAANATAIRAAVTGTLAAGASVSFVYTANVLGDPAAGEQACNSIATAATGVPVSEPSPVCAIVEAADLAVTAGAPTDLQIGRPAVLPFTVSNIGGTDATPSVSVAIPAGVRVTSLTFGDWTCTSAAGTAPVDGPAALTCVLDGTLAAGDDVALNLPVVVTADGVTVTATATSSLFDPDLINNEDEIVLDAAPAAAGGLTVAKDDGITALVAGQVTTYTISVRNQLVGEAVGDVRIADALPAGLEFVSASDGGALDAGSVVWTIPTIAAGGTAQVTVTARAAAGLTATSLANTVTAQAADPAFPGSTLTGSAADVDQVDRIALTKRVQMRSPGDVFDPQVGDVLEYTFVISNTGGGQLTGIVLDDPKSGLSTITYPDGWPAASGTLTAGQSVTATATYTVTAADIDAGATSNTATVTGDSAGGEEVSATASVDFGLPPVGGILFTKEGELDITATVTAGDEIEYSFEIVNTGNVTLSDVEITDALPGLSTITYTWPSTPGILGSGATATATATYALTQADIDRGTVSNTAGVSALDVLGEDVTGSDTADVVIPAVPAASITKTGELAGDAARPTAGGQVDFAFVVENTGNVTLRAVDIVDHLDGVSDVVFGDWPDADGVLAPGESVTATAAYLLSQADVDAGEIENTATMTATPTRGAAVSEDTGTTVTLAQVEGLVIVKTAELLDADGDGLANPGEQIRYSFALENTGNVTLSDVTVVDAKVTGIPVTTSLAPGQSVQVFSDPYTVTGADAASGSVRNTATATATAPDGTDVAAGESSTSTRAAASGDLATTGGTAPLWAIGLAGGLGAAGLLLILVVAWRRRERANA